MTTNSSVSRRAFLKSTAATVVAAPFLLPSHVWSAPVKPNDRVTLGFIGMGTQNRGLMGGFMGRKDTQVVAVCDVDTNRRDAAKARAEEHYAKQTGAGTYSGCTAYKDFRAMLVRRDIDAVVIATPDHWHAFISIAAANAGKDIYCEKPLCQSIHEARAMVKAVRRNKRVFQTGSMQRSSKEFRVACELVRNGVIGKVRNVEVQIGGPGRPCDLPVEEMEPGLDWDLWLGPAPDRGYHSELSPRGVHKHYPNWRSYREYGGGMVTDWGAHHFDIAQWGLGMDESGPMEILPADKPDAQEGVRLKYAGDVEVQHKSGNGVWFHGTQGKIFVNRGKFAFWMGEQQKAKETSECEAIAKEYLTDAKVKLYASKNHLEDFLSCMRTRQRPICDVEVGARTVSTCHLVNLAYQHGQKLKWNPKAEKFTGGTGNKAWLNVPHRDPWAVA